MKRSIETSEYIPMKKLKTLILNKDILRGMVKSEYEWEKVLMIENEMDKKTEELRVTYVRNKGYRYMPQIGEKRKPVSLSNLSVPFRSFLADGVYMDVDVVNCHPMILNALTSCGVLEEYCKNREYFLSSQGLNKRDFLAALYRNPRWPCKNKVLKSVTDHMAVELIPRLKMEFPDMWVDANRNHKNPGGSFLSLVLQHFESMVLTECVEYGKRLGVCIDVLIHDGFMVRIKDDETNMEEFITGLEKYIGECRFLGRCIPLKFVVKPFSKDVETLLFSDI